MAQPPVRWQPSEAHLHHLLAFYYRTEAGCEKARVSGLNRKNLERAGSGGTRTRTGDTMIFSRGVLASAAQVFAGQTRRTWRLLTATRRQHFLDRVYTPPRLIILHPVHLYPRPYILSAPGLEADQIQDIIGEREDSIQFTAYGLIRSSIVHFGHYLNLELASLSSAIYRPRTMSYASG